MASIFADFHEAQRVGSGHLLASCLAPVDTAQHPRRLQSFAQLSNHQTISADVRYHLLQDRAAVKLPKAEGNAWVEIFVALWSAVKELLATEHSLPQASWWKTFDAYKEVCNLVIRGYSSHGFQAWTVPVLYVTGKYLRLFAVRADTESKSKETMSFGNGFSDDVVGSLGKNDKLEQAAWIINRMFTICLSDRYVNSSRHPSYSWLRWRPGLRSQSRASGESTAPQIYFSRPISRYSRMNRPCSTNCSYFTSSTRSDCQRMCCER